MSDLPAVQAGSKAETGDGHPSSSHSRSAAGTSTLSAGHSPTAIRAVGKFRKALTGIEAASAVVSRARALEHVERTHPRVPGTLSRAVAAEPVVARNKESGALEQVSTFGTAWVWCDCLAHCDGEVQRAWFPNLCRRLLETSCELPGGDPRAPYDSAMTCSSRCSRCSTPETMP